MTTKRRKAVAYARFSPGRDREKSKSCDAQLADLRQYAADHDLEIGGEFTDKFVSGKEAADVREGLANADVACKRGYVFLVCEYDRLFRNAEKAMVFGTRMSKRGVQIVSIDQPAASLDTPMAKAMRHIMFVFAELNRELMAARTSKRMRAHQANGHRMSDETPYGTMRNPANPAELITNEREAAIVREIRAKYNGGMSMRAIARWLTKQRIPRRASAQGEAWNHITVRRILTREGVLRANGDE